jgi:hypothetical protein
MRLFNKEGKNRVRGHIRVTRSQVNSRVICWLKKEKEGNAERHLQQNWHLLPARTAMLSSYLKDREYANIL